MSDAPIRLAPLVCLKCAAPLAAEIDEIAWVCDTCGQGQMLDESGPAATRPLDMFFSTALRPGQKGRPFWVSRGQVVITRRDTFKGEEGRAAKDYWREPRLFYIPAWQSSLDEVVAMGIYLLDHPEGMTPGDPAAFLPVVTAPGDMHALAEFMVFSIEAARRDALKWIQFNLTLEPPQLWILP